MDLTEPRPEMEPHVGAIFRGCIITHPEHPGVSFILPHWSDPKACGQPVSLRGWPRPLLIVTGDLGAAEVEAAAVRIGRSFGHTASMRRAARSWAKSADCSRNPHEMIRAAVAQ